MTRRYYPPRYCGCDKLLQSAYYHLFPRPLSDSELIEASLRYLEFEDQLERNIRRLGATGISRRQEREIRHSIATLVTEIALCRFVERAMADRIFDPVLSLFPPFPEFEFLNFPQEGYQYVYNCSATKPDWPTHQHPPHHIIKLGFDRWNRVESLIRDKIFSGSLRCFIANHVSGIAELEGKNLWLNDEMSMSMLLSGKLSVENSDMTFDLMFNKKDVEQEFPDFERSEDTEATATAQSGSAKQTMPEKIADALIHLHPNGIPEAAYGEVGELKHQIAVESGIKVITDGTWRRGKKLYQERINGIRAQGETR